MLEWLNPSSFSPAGYYSIGVTCCSSNVSMMYSYLLPRCLRRCAELSEGCSKHIFLGVDHVDHGSASTCFNKTVQLPGGCLNNGSQHRNSDPFPFWFLASITFEIWRAYGLPEEACVNSTVWRGLQNSAIILTSSGVCRWRSSVPVQSDTADFASSSVEEHCHLSCSWLIV